MVLAQTSGRMNSVLGGGAILIFSGHRMIME
jgi:hypothetical protein